jgi:hypothetical protein
LLIEALLCNAAALADDKLVVFGREGTRLRLTAEFGRSDHGDASTRKPVRVGGQPVGVSRSVKVQRLPGSLAGASWRCPS